MGTPATREKGPNKGSETASATDQAGKHLRVVKSGESFQSKWSSALGNIFGTDGDLTLDMDLIPHTGLHQVRHTSCYLIAISRYGCEG